jgi:hypothetical protein
MNGEFNMKITNLLVGQVFKSFNELCRYLEVNPPKSGKEKENIVKKLKRYMEWQEVKKGRNKEMTITEIYETPKEIGTGKSEGSRRNNDKYQTDMSMLIEHCIANAKDEVLDITKNKLAVNSFIVSDLYYECIREEEGEYFDYLKETYSISNKAAYDKTCNKYRYTINGGIYSALNLLQEQGKIEYEKRAFIVINNEQKRISEPKNKTLILIEEEVMQEVMNKYSNINNRLDRYKVMYDFKYRKIYFRRVLEEFNKAYNLNAEMLFKGITIRNIACNVHEDITQISDKLNNTLMNLVVENNKEKVIDTKEAYNKKNEEKRNGFAFGGEYYKLPMKAYEEDMIMNEKSYIEDTIKLMKLFCGQVKQDVNEKFENTENAKILELNNHIKKDSKNEAESKDENDYEITTLNMVIYEYRNDIQKVQNKINRIEKGVKEGDLTALYKQLNHLYECYNEYYQMMLDSCKNDTPMAI